MSSEGKTGLIVEDWARSRGNRVREGERVVKIRSGGCCGESVD